MEADKCAIVIAAGGTGGHIMPAISVGHALAALAPQCAPLFVCGRREQEREWFNAAGIEPFALPARPMGQGIAGRIAGLGVLAFNTINAMRYLLRVRARAVLGMGGYVSAPTCLAALILQRPILIHEQNAVLGWVNWWLSGRAKIVAGAYREIESAAPKGRFRLTGNPVREGIGAMDRAEGRRAFGLDPERPVLVITGGSQGAQSLNRFVGEMLWRLDAQEQAAGLQVIWAAGKNRHEECMQQFAPESFQRLTLQIHPFIEKMEAFWAAATLAVARAGASTIAEVTLCGVPAVFFPLRTAAQDHQSRNAEALVHAGAAIRMSEYEHLPQELADALLLLLGNSKRCALMSRAAHKLARPHAARDLARLALEAAKCLP